MTTRRFYHTELRRYVTARVIDAGAKPPPEQPITVAEIVEHVGEPEPPKRRQRAKGESLQLIINAARQEPGTCWALAERTGLAVVSVQSLIARHRKQFVEVGSVRVQRGPARRIYGVMP